MFAWMVLPFLKYAQFRGRSRRREYWSFLLLNVIVTAGLGFLLISFSQSIRQGIVAAGTDAPAIYAALLSGPGMILAVWLLAMLVPGTAVAVRRLHDRGLSGWWLAGFLLLQIAPGFFGQYMPFALVLLLSRFNLLAGLVFLGLMAMVGTAGANRFGPDPRAPSTPQPERT